MTKTTKTLFRQASSLLRAALLLGAVLFVNVPSRAQVQQIPNAFEYIDPTRTTIIDDGQYYYVQLVNQSKTLTAYLTENGDGQTVRSRDFLPFTDNRLWKFISAEGGFTMESKSGLKLYYEGDRFKASATATPVVLNFYRRQDGSFEIYRKESENNGMNRVGGGIYVEMSEWGRNDQNNGLFITKLKDNAAFIIYYDKDNGDGSANVGRRSYITYTTNTASADGNHPVGSTSVSTRTSLFSRSNSGWQLPTAAAYHQDGLWVLEATGTDNEFYIHKHDDAANGYLTVPNASGAYGLGAKGTAARFTINEPNNNRYTGVKNSVTSTQDRGFFNVNGGDGYPLYDWTAPGLDGNSRRFAFLPVEPVTEDNLFQAVLTQIIQTTPKINFDLTSGTLNQGTTPEHLVELYDGGIYWLGRSQYVTYTFNSTFEGPASLYLDISGQSAKTMIFYLNGKEYKHTPRTISEWKEIVSVDNLKVGQNTLVITNGLNKTDGDDSYAPNIKSISIYQGINLQGGTFDYNGVADNDKVKWTEWNSLGNLGLGQTATYTYTATAAGTYTLYLDIRGNVRETKVTVNGTAYTIPAAGPHYVDVNLTAGNNTIVLSSTTDLNWAPDIYGMVLSSSPNIPIANTSGTKGFGVGFVDNNGNITKTAPVENFNHIGFLGRDENAANQTVTYTFNSDIASQAKLTINFPQTDRTLAVSVNGVVQTMTTQGTITIDVQQGTNTIVLSSGNAQWAPDITAMSLEYLPCMATATGWESNPTDDNRYYWDVEPRVPYTDYEDYYDQFYLKNSEGQYFKGADGTTANKAEAYTFTKTDLNGNNLTLTWYLTNAVTDINQNIVHKESYLKDYYTNHDNVRNGTGLAQDMDSDWKIQDGSIHNGTQKTNEFKITHYVKKDETMNVYLPTILYGNNQHIYYQRWYNYDTEDTEGLLDRVRYYTNDFGSVQGLKYNNGFVTGNQIYYDQPPLLPNTRRDVHTHFYYTNIGGEIVDGFYKDYTVAADVSRYSDYQYLNTEDYLSGDLVEPTLTMRYIYTFKDAKKRAEELTSCTGDKWLEEKTFHFPQKTVFYDAFKTTGGGDFISLFNEYRDYWVFKGGNGDENLVNLNNGGTINIAVTSNDPGLRDVTRYGERFIRFYYPTTGSVADENCGEEKAAVIEVKLNDGSGATYNIARFTIIFDQGGETLPWSQVQTDTYKARNPVEIRKEAGAPIAKITFDYPVGVAYKTPTQYYPPSTGVTRHSYDAIPAGTTINNSCPLPLKFDNTNYGFDYDGADWGTYCIVNSMFTRYGAGKTLMPSNDPVQGTGIAPDEGLQRGFMYIDASEQPGEICHVPFQGTFCPEDKLICTGWMSGSNKVTDGLNPSSVILTIKGRKNGVDETIYRYCPGQLCELPVGYTNTAQGGTGYYSEWQQFYFEFKIDKHYEEYWLEVNNNCINSLGGDFMLDDIEIFDYVPEVMPEFNLPLCIPSDAAETKMNLLKVKVSYPKLLKATSAERVTSGTGEEKEFCLVFLEKDKFLQTFKSNYDAASELTLKQIEDNFHKGAYKPESLTPEELVKVTTAYKKAFDEALLNKDDLGLWDSRTPDTNKGKGVLRYWWNTKYDEMPEYKFEYAADPDNTNYKPVYRQEIDGEEFVILNANYAKLPWKVNTEYFVISNTSIPPESSSADELYLNFDLTSPCCRYDIFTVKPPLELLSMESANTTEELEVCQGKIPTILTNLKGYNIDGGLVAMENLNFDWWLGDPPTTVATLENYHTQKGSDNVTRLDEALSMFRLVYPDANTLDGVTAKSKTKVTNTYEVTEAQIACLKEFVDNGQLILHQKSLNIPAQKVSDDDPYSYLVVCPIHDDFFEQALNMPKDDYVVFFCDEPQGVRMKITDNAPTVKTGFVANENGYSAYHYDDTGNPNMVLSVRLANKEQFRTVQHGTSDEAPVAPTEANKNDTHYLWLPLRDADVLEPGSNAVTRKTDDYNIYLASSNDPVWDQNVYREMSKNSSLPIVGKIVQLDATTNTANENNYNRLCVYFTSNFDVREGYTYTLSLPFMETPGVNACSGNILINLKIVPDYEVWTGGAGNPDWNNDQNWRRADGNDTSTAGTDNNELYVSDDLPTTSPLSGYTTNRRNYRNDRDRVFRQGFAPLYCTHILMKSDEWGNAPKLYDALDGNTVLSDPPFANLRDTSTPILKFDMQARLFDIWSETYGAGVIPNKGRAGDLIAEMYQINSCDEIAFQPGTELQNAHLLNYNSAWVEYQLDNERWYLLGSSLQGTISGEWYAPHGTAQQKTTYYEDVKFGTGYDRYSPAFYQRSWDKAKAVLYEPGSEWSSSDNDTGDLGTGAQGEWVVGGQNTYRFDTTGADDYLQRITYKPFGSRKVNVAVKGLWSSTYNDATVDYGTGAFSVMVMNGLKGGDTSGGKSIVRLPKEDTFFDYYSYSQTGANDGGTYTNLTGNNGVQTLLSRAKNRGRLKSDLLLPESVLVGVDDIAIRRQEKELTPEEVAGGKSYRYGDRRTYNRIPTKEAELKAMNAAMKTIPETAVAGESSLGYYLVANPFQTGLDMDKFFENNSGLEKKYWLLTAEGQLLNARTEEGWVSPIGGDFAAADGILAPGQGFFVQKKAESSVSDVTFTDAMQAQTRYGKQSGTGTEYEIEVGKTYVMKDKVDESGNTVYLQKVDENGPVFEQKKNGQGQPKYYDSNGEETTDATTADGVANRPVMIPVYETDGSGNPVPEKEIDYEEIDGVMVPKTESITEVVTVYKYVQDEGTVDEPKTYPLRAPMRSAGAADLGLVITARRGDYRSSALVMLREDASDEFLPSEDTETFIDNNLAQVPTVYTLCGRLATTINSIRNFRCLPVGVESNSATACTLTFDGVETLGDSVAIYDAVEQTLTPLESGYQMTVAGRTQNRYYIVKGLSLREAANESSLQIYTEGNRVTVVSLTGEPIRSVNCVDVAGRLLHSAAPQSATYSFDLSTKGVCIIDAQTKDCHKTKKMMVKY